MNIRANELAAQVSQSEKLWLASSQNDRSFILLNAAPTWLEINAYSLNIQNGLFNYLLRHINELSKLAIHGLYLGPIAERPDIWVDSNSSVTDFGDGAASFAFDQSIGDEDEYESLAQRAEQEGIELGADLIPISTGRGPDFLLQARAAPATAGTYAMIETPKENWQNLPVLNSEWDYSILDNHQQLNLIEKQILPAKLSRDDFAWSKSDGWAVTGIIRGVDGKERRWLYRFHRNPSRPVMAWNDPFGRAKRILAASAIRQTGLQGQTLVGLHMAPLFGLEPKPDNESIDLEPGLTALNDVSSQIHRYGGWALQADAVPEDVIHKILQGPCDFCRDDVSGALLISSMIKKNAHALTLLFRKRLKNNLNLSRLARGFNNWRATDFNIIENCPDPVLYDRQLTYNEFFKMAQLNADQAMSTLLSFRLGLPGLAFVSPQEFSFLQKSQEIFSVPRDEPAAAVDALLHKRAMQNLADGKLLEALEADNGKIIGFLTALPNGNFWFLGMNLDSRSRQISFLLPRPIAGMEDALNNSTKNITLSRQKCYITLDGGQTQNVIFFAE